MHKYLLLYYFPENGDDIINNYRPKMCFPIQKYISLLVYAAMSLPILEKEKLLWMKMKDMKQFGIADMWMRLSKTHPGLSMTTF